MPSPILAVRADNATRAATAVEAAIAAIASAWADDPGCRWELHAGEARAFGAAAAEVLHPPAEVGRPRDLNAISSPMLVRYGDTRVLLGADLPRPGWARIGAGHAEGPTLRDAAALKASHHGSKPAQHAVAIGAPPRRDRFVTLTPFNRGERLPRFEADHGIAELLACHEEVHLTASPVALPAPGQRHSRGDLDAAHRRRRFGEEALILTYEAPPASVDEAWTAIAIDASGRVAGTWFGADAVTVF